MSQCHFSWNDESLSIFRNGMSCLGVHHLLLAWVGFSAWISSQERVWSHLIISGELQKMPEFPYSYFHMQGLCWMHLETTILFNCLFNKKGSNYMGVKFSQRRHLPVIECFATGTCLRLFWIIDCYEMYLVMFVSLFLSRVSVSKPGNGKGDQLTFWAQWKGCHMEYLNQD